MIGTTMKWFAAGLTALALSSAVEVVAQGSPTHRGQNTRTGTHENPLDPGPGTARLRWWHPLQSTVGRGIAVDNTSPDYSEPTGSWTTPGVFDEAPDWLGSGANPYRYALAVPSTAGTGDPTAGATATARWVINGTPNTLYALYAWFPSSGTRVGGIVVPNSVYAVYRIEFGNGQQFTDIVPHLGGGSWLRLGRKLGVQDRIFNSGNSGQITVTLYNTVPRDSNDELMGPHNNRIVVGDAVLAVPNPGEIWSSPIVKDIGPAPGTDLVVSVRNAAIVDPNDPNGTLEATAATVYGIDAAGPNISLPRWSWSPRSDIPPVVVDNTNPAFTADSAWTPSTMRPGYTGVDYMRTLVFVGPPPGTARARWTPTLPRPGNYDIYVWLFPGNFGPPPEHTTAARYVVNSNGTETEFYVDQSAQGPGWVRIGTTSFNHNPLLGGLRLELWNQTPNPPTDREVIADAAMFVYADPTPIEILSTPTLATVNIRTNTGPIVPTEVVFVAAEDGRIYCIDARGVGGGRTIVYWAYPSIPNPNVPNWTDPNDSIDGPLGNRIPMPGSFGISSMAVANIGGEDLLFIAAGNGRVYAINCIGRGDYDPVSGAPGTTMRKWTWPKAVYNNSTGLISLEPGRRPFVGSVAYDASTNQIFVGGTEGRLFALRASGTSGQETAMNWAYPPLSSSPIGAITSTPAVGGGMVIVPSYDGRVYALPVGGGSPNWVFPPPANDPPLPTDPRLSPFTYTSVAYVPSSRLGAPTPPSDLVYFINEDGRAYCLRADDGTLMWSANEVPAGAQSSPYFTYMIPSGLGSVFPVITFGTNTGAFLALYANPAHSNSAGGRLAWGRQSLGERVFASPAVHASWMYHAGLDGYLYAFATGGLISNDPGFQPPGTDIGTPDDPLPGFDNMAFKFIGRADYGNLRQSPPAITPQAASELYPPPQVPALEWGETLFMVAYNFVYPPDPQPKPTIRFTVTGPGGLNLRFDRPAELVLGATPGDPNSGFATIGVPINATGNNFVTPGDQIQVDVEVIYNAQQYNPPNLPARVVTVANPLAIATVSNLIGAPPFGKMIGWTNVANDPENLINGSPVDKRVMSSAGQVIHGQNGASQFFVADRSRILELTGLGLTNVMMLRGDAAWQGGIGAVVKPLPYVPAWEQLPGSIPNFSLDYPDIDRALIDIIANPFGQPVNPLLRGVQLLPPDNYDPNAPLNRVIRGVPFGYTISVERYQPANLTTEIDAAGDRLPFGYSASAVVYVDSNNNLRPDGLEETLVNVQQSARREAYRSFLLTVGVPIDESLSIVEPTVDLGSYPHSLGFTTMPPWQPGNLFWPDLSGAFGSFFQPFTVQNTGNVNLLDLRVGTRVGRLPGPTYTPIGFIGDVNDPLAWIDGSLNIITNINPPYAPDMGVYDSSGNPRVTLHKARAGDRAPTILTVPDVPYGVTPPPNSQPVIGVAVPPGFPVGQYSRFIHVIEDSYLVNGRNDIAVMIGQNGVPLEAYTDPTMRVQFNNREARATGGRTRGTSAHVDDNPTGAPTNFRYTNSAPTGFRDSLGNLHMAWQANRPDFTNPYATPQAQDNWNLYFGFFQGALPSAGPGASPLRDLMAWSPNNDNRFWNPFAGPEPGTPPSTLFAGLPGTIIGAPKYTDPAFVINPRFGGPNQPINSFVFWSGVAQKDNNGDSVPDYSDNRMFYASYTVQPNSVPVIGQPAWLLNDQSMEKKRLRPIRFGTGGLAVFWHGDVSGQSKMFHNVRFAPGGSGNQTANWSTNFVIDPGAGFASTSDPTPIERFNAQGQSVGIDLAFTGLLKDGSQPEVYYTKYVADSFGRLRQQLYQPERNREALIREPSGNTYRARGVNWDTRQPIEVWLRRPNQSPVRIDIPASRVVDDNTGVVSFDSATGGKIYCDPHVGVIRFSTQPPPANAAVELRYTPAVIRVSELGSTGGHMNPSSFLDNRQDWNRTYWSRPGAFSPIAPNEFPRVGRLWHIYERGASGAGQSRRPYMKTQRLTLRTPNPIAIDANTGYPLISVSPNGGYYQVDPMGKVYFELSVEGTSSNPPPLVSITYQYRADDGTLLTGLVNGRPQWQTEMAEQPVPIEQAVDESTVYAFLDPFFDTYNPADPRPGFVWVIFTSSRAGTRDVYYISIAPRAGPYVIRN